MTDIIKKFWTEGEIKLLRQVYPDMFAEDVAKLFNCTTRQVYNAAFKFKIKKSEEWMQKELERQADRLKIAGNIARFKPGHIPPNKGKKMDPEQYNKCKLTFFTKGNIPHNTKWNGYERITKDGYTEIRVDKGQFKLKHRIVWEQVNGPIPKGMIIVFKDNNKKNIDINNLELISRKEGINRNRLVQYPPELRTLIKLNNKLKKKINEK
jgi:hypothetical protein